MEKENFEKLLAEVVMGGASDLHISVGRKPQLRVDGSLVTMKDQPIITREMGESFLSLILTPEQSKRFHEEKEIDFSYALDNVGRFRVNVFLQRGQLAAALRLIPDKIKTLDELGHPAILHNILKVSQGFFLVVGPSGQGKSTTLAAMIDEINHNRKDHILTVEDPIEYLFEDDKSIVDQRE